MVDERGRFNRVDRIAWTAGPPSPTPRWSSRPGLHLRDVLPGDRRLWKRAATGRVAPPGPAPPCPRARRRRLRRLDLHGRWTWASTWRVRRSAPGAATHRPAPRGRPVCATARGASRCRATTPAVERTGWSPHVPAVDLGVRHAAGTARRPRSASPWPGRTRGAWNGTAWVNRGRAPLRQTRRGRRLRQPGFCMATAGTAAVDGPGGTAADRVGQRRWPAARRRSASPCRRPTARVGRPGG